MLKELKEYKGKSSTACPSVGDWLEAFGDADIVYGSAITSHLSGCYNAAAIAADEYRGRYPGRKVFILDTLSTGPEMELITEKYRELIRGEYPDCDLKIGPNRGLCCYYAEEGGFLVGFET